MNLIIGGSCSTFNRQPPIMLLRLPFRILVAGQNVRLFFSHSSRKSSGFSDGVELGGSGQAIFSPLETSVNLFVIA